MKLFFALAATVCSGFSVVLLVTHVRKVLRQHLPLHAFRPQSSFRLKESLEKNITLLKSAPHSKESLRIRLAAAAAVFLASLLVCPRVIFDLLIAGGVFFALGGYFQKKIDRENELFDTQLAEALGTLIQGLRSGQSLQQALENMAGSAPEPLAGRFREALAQVHLGMPLAQALLSAAEITCSRDLRSVVTALTIAKETGGNLTDILSRLVETMRERRKIRGKLLALTAQGRMSGTVMGLAPFLMLAVLYVMEPDIMGLLFTTTPGNLMLAVAVVMVALGMFFIRRIVAIEV